MLRFISGRPVSADIIKGFFLTNKAFTVFGKKKSLLLVAFLSLIYSIPLFIGTTFLLISFSQILPPVHENFFYVGVKILSDWCANFSIAQKFASVLLIFVVFAPIVATSYLIFAFGVRNFLSENNFEFQEVVKISVHKSLAVIPFVVLDSIFFALTNFSEASGAVRILLPLLGFIWGFFYFLSITVIDSEGVGFFSAIYEAINILIEKFFMFVGGTLLFGLIFSGISVFVAILCYFLPSWSVHIFLKLVEFLTYFAVVAFWQLMAVQVYALPSSPVGMVTKLRHTGKMV